MAIFPLYKDFFRFLRAIRAGRDPWPVYQDFYIRPHRDFFRAYWAAFFPHLDVVTLQDRVRRVRPGHYTALSDLIAGSDLSRKIANTLELCQKRLPVVSRPDVYLVVGFFSADGFIVTLRGVPVIGIGLERYRDFHLLNIILAHEFCHFARHLALGLDRSGRSERLDRKLISEGLSVCFSRQVFPGRPLCDHLLMSRQRLNWCRRNEKMLLALIQDQPHSDQLTPVLFGTGGFSDGIPPRAGMYLGYRLVEDALIERGPEALADLLSIRDVSAIWPPASTSC